MKKPRPKTRSKKPQPWFAYILRCSDGTLYSGATNNLVARLKTHNDGKASKYTRSRLPVTFVYNERCGSRGDALRREAALKRLSRTEKQQLVITRSTGKTKTSQG